MLTDGDTVASLGAAVDDCMRSACATWRKMHFPALPWETAFTEEVYKIETAVSYFQDGLVKVRVYLHGRKTDTRENFIWTFRRGLDNALICEGYA
jgi:hypothetical protein